MSEKIKSEIFKQIKECIQKNVKDFQSQKGNLAVETRIRMSLQSKGLDLENSFNEFDVFSTRMNSLIVEAINVLVLAKDSKSIKIEVMMSSSKEQPKFSIPIRPDDIDTISVDDEWHDIETLASECKHYKNNLTMLLLNSQRIFI